MRLIKFHNPVLSVPTSRPRHADHYLVVTTLLHRAQCKRPLPGTFARPTAFPYETVVSRYDGLPEIFVIASRFLARAYVF